MNKLNMIRISAGPRKSDLTPEQHRRHLRNLTICAEAAEGVSHRQLAVIHDLDPSRITRIIKEYRKKYGEPKPAVYRRLAATAQAGHHRLRQVA